MHYIILPWLVLFFGAGPWVSWEIAKPNQPDAENEPLVRVERVEPHMGTRFQITAYARDKETGEKALAAGFARISRINKILSDYDAQSETMLLCARAGGPPVMVSPELLEIMEHSLELSRKTEGAFDVTVGPLTLIWRRARKSLLMPDKDEIQAAKQLVGSGLVTLDKTRKTIQLTKKGMRLDFGGIGKGYAADQVLDTLKNLGITRALVAAGGDITCSGPPPGKTGWAVEIIPLPGDPSAGRYFSLAHGAVSTSGDMEKYLQIGDRRFSHLLDPKTGLGITTRMSASVVSRRGMDSDSLTKVLLLLDPEKAGKILKSVTGTSGRLVKPRDLEDLTRGAEVKFFGEFPRLRENAVDPGPGF